MEENLNVQQPGQRANNDQEFSQRISRENIHTLLSDSIPSLILIIFIFIAFGSTSTWCYDNYPLFLKGMILVYTAFITKSIVNFCFLYRNTQEGSFQKVSILSLDFLITFIYYAVIVAGFLIFKNKPDSCFKTNPYPTVLIFCLLIFALANIGRTVLSVLLDIICFPIMVYYFVKNPSSFYSQFGIDPEIVQGLPTIAAGPEHLMACAICTIDIQLEEQILVLKCEGRHFFHSSCIKSWLLQKVNCPICRSENVI